MSITVRPARAEDATGLPDVERDAGMSFLAITDLAWLASDKVMSAEQHLPAIVDRACWVAEVDSRAIVGFLTAERCGSDLHIWEVAVRGAFQRRGIGRRLIGGAADLARIEGLAALTLTTFRDVAWNAPFYARLGFQVLVGADLDARLAQILKHEAEQGLPPERRCAMRLSFN
jgi:GNAT superfamily N-acetyltransferase